MYATMPKDPTERRDLIRLFAPIFNTPGLTVVSHELKRDKVMLACEGIDITGPCFDTQLAHYLVDTDARHTLPEIANSYIGYETHDYKTEPRLRKPYTIQDPESAMTHSC